MRLILCLDDRNGMMFHHRRQSRDRAVIEDVLAELGNGTLYIRPYSAPLFEAYGVGFCVSEEIPDGRAEDAYFLEDRSPLPYMERFSSLTVYRWNRHYPADLRLDADPKDFGFRLTRRVEFAGTSHEVITKECFET